MCSVRRILEGCAPSVSSVRRITWGLVAAAALLLPGAARAQGFRLDSAGYLHARGADVLVFSNWYSGLFSDSKLSGVELVHHGVRTATNGDVRLSDTPEQWDPTPRLDDRRMDQATGRIAARLSYPDYDFQYAIEAEPRDGGVRIAVVLERPLPPALAGKAGFNLEFLPSAYFGKAYLADGRAGLFPRAAGGRVQPSGASVVAGLPEPEALDSARTLVLAPEDPERRVTIEALLPTLSAPGSSAAPASGGFLRLYDGRNKAQNGWFVVRALLPAGRTGRVLEWQLTPNRIPGWTRPPVIAHSQAGYGTRQAKVAVLELDPNDDGIGGGARLLRIEPDGREVERLRGPVRPWGRWLRYRYARFDFSAVTEPGLYRLAYAGVRSEPFPIGDDVYRRIWQSTLDTFMPVQMDHALVREAYRVWHGAAHLDDARQAPVGHQHFDLYAQGPTTDSPFQPGQHIPGLDVGGWFDAGDYDIRTQSVYATVENLALAYETFGIDWDETTVRPARRTVELRRPDGVPDALEQIRHGALALLAQYRAIGHAIPGIIDPTLVQYTHLGDALTDTDNLVYDPTLDSLTADGRRSGIPDDRWAFTSRSTPLDYGAAAALAAAARVLGRADTLAAECLRTAMRVWDEEQSRAPVIFRSGNTTGGPLEDEKLRAAVELLITSQGQRKYAEAVAALWPYTAAHFESTGALAARALPYMDAAYRRQVEGAVVAYRKRLDAELARNPFGVPFATGGWAGSGQVLAFAMRSYILHRAFPALIGPEYTLRGLEYVLGTHPGSSVSLVSGIGARSKTIAYGANRADYSFIPGGIVPGVLLVQPDLPELKEDWPFLWYEEEYVITQAPLFIYVANAADRLLATP